jgi:hypothetical protein
MPPRYAYWTILVDNQPTAFRAGAKEDLLPTFNRLKAKNDTAVMMWFQNGKLWPSRLDAQEAMIGRGEAGRRSDPRQSGGGFRDRDRKPTRDRGARSAWSPRGEPSTPPPARNADDKLDWKPKGEFVPAPKRADRAEWKPKKGSFDRERKPDWKPKGSFDRESKPKSFSRPSFKESGDDTRSAKPEWKPKGSFDRKTEWKPKPSFDRGAKPDWKPKGSFDRGAKPDWKPKASFERGAKPDWKSKGSFDRGAKPDWKSKPSRPQGLKPSRPEKLEWKPKGDSPSGSRVPDPGSREKRPWVPKAEYKKSLGIEAKRDDKWRPGGEHRDPKQKYKDAKKAKWTKFKKAIRTRAEGKRKKDE